MSHISNKYIQVHVARKKRNTFEFLALKRSNDQIIYPNLWQVITGNIEGNEKAYEAAARELLEETGIKINKLWSVPYITSFYEYTDDSIQLSSVFGILCEENTEVRLSDEHQEFRWEDFEDHLKTLALYSHKEACRIFYNEILLKPKNVMKEIEIK